MHRQTRRNFLKLTTAVTLGASKSQSQISIRTCRRLDVAAGFDRGRPCGEDTTFDALARARVMFTNAYVALRLLAVRARCSPGNGTGGSRRAQISCRRCGQVCRLSRSARTERLPRRLHRKGWGPGSEAASGRTAQSSGPGSRTSPLSSRPAPREAFCFRFGSNDPHRQYKWESGVESGLKLEDVRVPPYLADSDTVRKDICDYYLAVQRFDRETGELLAMLERWASWTTPWS
jgi:hypothetical protein